MDYLTFQVGKEWYGVKIDRIIEVLHFVGLTELPGSNPDVLGLLTLRDIIMPVVDLRLHFGQEDAELGLDTPVVAINTAQGPMAMVVDDVDDVEQITDLMDYDGIETPHIEGAVKFKGRLLLLLNIEQIYANIKTTNMIKAIEAVTK